MVIEVRALNGWRSLDYLPDGEGQAEVGRVKDKLGEPMRCLVEVLLLRQR